jgi:hypothetical protein
MESALDIQPTRNVGLALAVEVHMPKLTNVILAENGLQAIMRNSMMVLDTVKSAIVLRLLAKMINNTK